jgi:hypothetical protein
LAGFDPARYRSVLSVALREALVCYEAKLKDEARSNYEFQLVTWAILAQAGGKAKPPELPEILKD